MSYYQKNKEKVKARVKAYRDANKEKLKAAKKVSYQKNKDKVLATCAKYYENNKEKILAQNKEYRILHAEEIKKRKSKYHQGHKQELKAQKKKYKMTLKGKEVSRNILRKWRNNNPEKYKAHRIVRSNTFRRFSKTALYLRRERLTWTPPRLLKTIRGRLVMRPLP